MASPLADSYPCGYGEEKQDEMRCDPGAGVHPGALARIARGLLQLCLGQLHFLPDQDRNVLRQVAEEGSQSVWFFHPGVMAA